MSAPVGGALAGLLATGLRSQNGDAEILTYFDVVRIFQRRIEFMNLLQKFRSAGSELFCANTDQGLPSSHADCARGGLGQGHRTWSIRLHPERGKRRARLAASMLRRLKTAARVRATRCPRCVRRLQLVVGKRQELATRVSRPKRAREWGVPAIDGRQRERRREPAPPARQRPLSAATRRRRMDFPGPKTSQWAWRWGWG